MTAKVYSRVARRAPQGIEKWTFCRASRIPPNSPAAVECTGTVSYYCWVREWWNRGMNGRFIKAITVYCLRFVIKGNNLAVRLMGPIALELSINTWDFGDKIGKQTIF